MIIFYVLRLPEEAANIKVTVQRAEVDAYAWLSFDDLRKVLSGGANCSISFDF